MFDFFNKEKNKNIKDPLAKIAALLIHVAKIDENYTEKERSIIKKAIIDLGSNNEVIDDILIKAYISLNKTNIESINISDFKLLENDFNLGTLLLEGKPFSVDVNEDLMKAIDIMPNDPIRKLY